MMKASQFSSGIKKHMGFTLLELLVVMAIIGILAAIGIASYSGVQAKARDARRKSDLENVARAAEMYYNDHGVYPVEGEIPWGGTWMSDSGNSLYMQKVPRDARFEYTYEPSTDRKSFLLFARFENTQDSSPGVAGEGQIFIVGGSEGAAITKCTRGCNFVIGSPNASPPSTMDEPKPQSVQGTPDPDDEPEDSGYDPECGYPEDQGYDQCMQEKTPYDPCDDPQSQIYNDCRT